MSASATRSATAGGAGLIPPETLYEGIQGQLDRLILLLGLERTRAVVERAYAVLCADSLSLPAGERPLRASRLNADGTPFQLGLTLGAGPPPLQFLAEPGPPYAGNAERLALARERVEELAELFDASGSLPVTRALLDELAPPDDPVLMADEAGSLWIGASFAPDLAPRLRIYVNARWGREPSRWARLETLAAAAGLSEPWERIRPLAAAMLEPLGVSLDVAAGAPLAGRIYLSGYGRHLHDYEALAEASGSALGRRLSEFCETMLGEDCRYPMRSIVYSLGGRRGSPDAKLELCAHCAMRSDVEARARSVEWLRRSCIPPEPYLQVLDVVTAGRLSPSSTDVHVFLGVGEKHGALSSTFYLNPAGALR